MIQLRLIILGLTVIGSIGLAVYHHYKAQEEQQQHQHSQNGRRGEAGGGGGSLNGHDLPLALPQPRRSNSSRKRRREVKPTCSICLCTVEQNGRYLNCGHGFHQNCIRVWFNTEKSCPNCRSTAI